MRLDEMRGICEIKSKTVSGMIKLKLKEGAKEYTK